MKIIIKKVRFFSRTWVLECFFCFVFGENVFLRRSLQEVFCKEAVLRNFAKLTGNHRARVYFLIKLQAPCNFIKKETLAQAFSCEFCEISKTPFLQNTSGRLLLDIPVFIFTFTYYWKKSEQKIFTAFLGSM